MKKIFLFNLLIVSVLLVYSCENNSGISNPEQYTTVYMPKADENPIQNDLVLSDTTYAFLYNAYLGGSVLSNNDIHITFDVSSAAVDSFNKANGTDYPLMPEENYSIETKDAVIPAGRRSTDDYKVTVKTDNLGIQTYLLPVSIAKIEGIAESVSKTLGTTYFILKATPKVASRKKVLELGRGWGDILTKGPDGILYRRGPDKFLWVHEPNEDGVYEESPTKLPGNPWDASGWFWNINENTEFVVNDDGHYGGFRFDVDPNTYFLTSSQTVNPSDPFPNNFGFYYGDGWNIYDILSAGDFIFLVNKINGDVLQVKMSDFLNKNPGTWHKINDLQDANNVIATGFDVYKNVLVLGISGNYYLLTVKNDGTLWYYPISEKGGLGDAKQIGSGWDGYDKFITTEDDILALDSNGDLFRYTNIDLNNFYRVKN